MKILTKQVLARQLQQTNPDLTQRRLTDIIDTLADLVVCHFVEGGEIAVLDGEEWDAQFSSPESLAGLAQVQELMTKASVAAKDGDETEAWVPFRTGKAATLSAPSWAYWSIVADEDGNETPLTGKFERKHADVDMQAVLREIDDARAEDAARRLRMATAA